MIDAARAVGIGKMRHVDDGADAGNGAGMLPGRTVRGRREAQAAHARVDLQLDTHRPLQARQLQHAQLLLAMDGGGQSVLLDQRQVFRLEEALEQQDRPLPAQLAQPDGLVQIEQAEAVGLAQPLIGTLDAVAICVGLDDRPDARVRGVAANHLEIVGECGAVDDGLNGSWHDDKPAK